jgi:hypothetical protein
MAGEIARRRRHADAIGCGLVLFAFLSSALPAGRARAQMFSPGPLARPHAALEGLDKCLRCHSDTSALSPAGCLGCHTELAPSLKAGTGFHGRLPTAKKDACQDCHPDHRGRDFPLIDWPGGRKAFDHARAGWRLEGAHARATCESCHRQAQTAGSATYLGLTTRCSSCHFDEHRGQLGADCQRCHNETKWMPAPGFDHGRVGFALRGKHIGIACAKCHPSMPEESGREESASAQILKPVAATFMQMKPIDHRTCESCHSDPHQGKLGPACSNCHTDSGWLVLAIKRQVDSSFHDQTQYPLRGGHIGVPCRSCHGPSPGKPARYKGLPSSRCADCHQDGHVGQLAAGRKGASPDCSSCHTVDGFSPPRFEVEQHATTRFPLDGGHAVTACRGCHALDDHLAAKVPSGVRRLLRLEKRPLEVSLAVMRPPERPGACADCHADAHAGQFAEVKGHDCGGCHVPDSFHRLKFDHARQSRFPLEGAHAALACSSCHTSERTPAGQTVVRYKPLPITCAGCHADEHQGQFGVRPDCAGCHRATTFKETTFSHEDRRFTEFSLGGKHATVPCASCHARVDVAPGVRAVWYRGVPTACGGCHVDFHHGDFRGLQP